MSLRRLSLLTDNVANIIIYSQSPSLSYHVQVKLKDHFKVLGDYIVSVNSAKQLTGAKLDSHVAPILCDKWLIHVNMDKLTEKELKAALNNNTRNAITVYWTEKYVSYKKVSESDTVKSQGSYCQLFTFSRLEIPDIMTLHREMVPEEKHLKPFLLDFVCSNYKYDPQAVCDLFAFLRSGDEVKTKRDIMEQVGIGGTSVETLVVRILAGLNTSFAGAARSKFREETRKKLRSTRSKNPDLDLVDLYGKLVEGKRGGKNMVAFEQALSKAIHIEEYQQRQVSDQEYLELVFDIWDENDVLDYKRKLFTSILALIEDLHSTYNYQTLRRFMLNSIDGFIEMKQLQVMGIYGRFNIEIPDTFNLKRLSRLKRFERVILNHISMSKLLNLRLCLTRYNNFNTQVSLIQAVSEYFNISGSIEYDPKQQKRG